MTINESLRPWTRLPVPGIDARGAWLRDALCLAGAGLAAACAVLWLDFNLRIPGHAILRCVLPIAFGMALVPRYGSGSLIGLSALGSAAGLGAWSGEPAGWGALTSLLVTGPVFDIALWNPRSGRGIYWRCALAGLAVNAVAFTVRGSAKLTGRNADIARPFLQWLPTAAVSYALCGLAAGLLSAVLFFRWSSPARASETGST